MKKLKVTLVVPNFRWSDWDVNTLWHFIPYNLCLLAAMIEDTSDVNILDAYKVDMSEEAFKAEIEKLNPDVVGITVLMDQYATSGHTAARLIKSVSKDIKVILGGIYATVNPEKAIKDANIDFLVIGEGEYVLRDLLNHFVNKSPLPRRGICYRLNGEIINTGHADFIENLDEIPFPAYHLIDFNKYGYSAERKSVDSPRKLPYTRLVTSRGCPVGCGFCEVESIMGRRFRPRSPKNVLDEMQFMKEKYGINSIMFDDDNFFTDKQRAKDILQGMVDRNLVMPWYAPVAVFRLDEELVKLMRKSGCEYIDIAIESGTERVSKQVIRKPVNFKQAVELVKLIRKEGIFVVANFIIGFPTETWDEIRYTLKFAEEIDVDYAKIFVFVPLPKTRLWELCKKEGALRADFDSAKWKWSIGQTKGNEFTSNDLTILRAYEWDRINFMDPKKRKRTAEMMSITEEELFVIRRKTLNNACNFIKL